MSALRLGRLVLERPLVGLRGLASRGAISIDARASTRRDTPWSVLMLRRQLAGLDRRIVPVTWTGDRTLDGFYRITEPQSTIVEHAPDVGVAILDLAVTCEPVARGTVDFESVLVGDTLTNVHGLTGTRWHSPPAGVTGYFSDPLPSAPLARTSVDGTVQVWREVPTHALWSVDPDGFYAGASRIRQNAAVVTGSMLADAPGIFELNNGLVRARFIVGQIIWDDIDGTWDDLGDLTWDDLDGFEGVEISVWQGGEWRRKRWEVRRAGAMFTPSKVAVIRNEPHVCSVRLVEERAPGRTTLDLTLRRGARQLQGFVRTESASLKVRRASAEAGTAIAGGVKASAADADGITYVVASPHDVAKNLSQGAISRTADRLAFMVGGTPSTATGQSPEAMVGQWVAATDEAVRAVLR